MNNSKSKLFFLKESKERKTIDQTCTMYVHVYCSSLVTTLTISSGCRPRLLRIPGLQKNVQPSRRTIFSEHSVLHFTFNQYRNFTIHIIPPVLNVTSQSKLSSDITQLTSTHHFVQKRYLPKVYLPIKKVCQKDDIQEIYTYSCILSYYYYSFLQKEIVINDYCKTNLTTRKNIYNFLLFCKYMNFFSSNYNV